MNGLVMCFVSGVTISFITILGLIVISSPRRNIPYPTPDFLPTPSNYAPTPDSCTDIYCKKAGHGLFTCECMTWRDA